MAAQPSLVLLPGLSDDGALWTHQVRHLADIADARAADISGHETVEAMARSVLDKAPRRFALAGFSLGGYVSLAILRTAPERVAKLALIATSARADTEARRAERRLQIDAMAQPGGFEEHMRRDLSYVVHPSRLTDKPLVAALLEMQGRQGVPVFIRQSKACMVRPDSRPHLEKIACPTLVLSGREDRVLPLELSEEIARGIPNARHVVVEECGHYLPLERPHAVTALLREWFLYA
ncbi:MAG: alpha/beta fold hydrolase [Alphaproteobacteria bacterium]